MRKTWNATTLLTEATNLVQQDQADIGVAEAVIQLVRAESVLRAALVKAVAVMVSEESDNTAGHAATVDQLRNVCHLTGREAHELAVAAPLLRDHLHGTFHALASGAITWAHAATVVRAVKRLGLAAVCEAESDWIELIASRTSSEALQRVVHTRHVEQVGYPARMMPEHQVSEIRSPSSREPSAASEFATSTPSTGGNADDLADIAETGTTSQVSSDQASGAPQEQPCEHNDVRVLPQARPALDSTAETSAPSKQQASPASTPSGDNASTEDASAASTVRCIHPGCVAQAAVRAVSFTMCWLDGGQSTILGHGPLCDQHAIVLTDCSIDEIRVGQHSTIRTFDSDVVAHAA
jgi:hypothetical protein